MRDFAHTIEIVARTNLCTSCGVCKGVCPKQCISFRLEGGLYKPQVDKLECIDCGLCRKCCPSVNNTFGENLTALEAMAGESLAVYNGWSTDSEVRHFAASGGVVTTIIRSLLEAGEYDIAFSLDTFYYSEQLKTLPKTSEDYKISVTNNLPKSRYLPISHENAVKHIRTNREKKVILIGTSCAIRGINNVISNLNLSRSNYLLIGLFCDKVFNYSVSDYFADQFAGGKEVQAYHFKNKDSGGWPGDMKLMFSSGESKFVSGEERCKVKTTFMPERCLYCIDKVNVSADISVGDNYTQFNYTPKGSNSIVVRTQAGLLALQCAKDNLELFEITAGDVAKAQVFPDRAKNINFAFLKQDLVKKEFGEELCLNGGVICESYEDYREEYQTNLNRLCLGRNYENNPQAVLNYLKETEKVEKKANMKYAIRSFLGNIKQKIFK